MSGHYDGVTVMRSVCMENDADCWHTAAKRGRRPGDERAVMAAW